MSSAKERSMSVFGVEVNRNGKVDACIGKVGGGGGDKSWRVGLATGSNLSVSRSPGQLNFVQ